VGLALPFRAYGRTGQNTSQGITTVLCNGFKSQLNNGILEGINSLFQAAKRKTRGYRSHKNIVAMVYLLAGKLDFSLK